MQQALLDFDLASLKTTLVEAGFEAYRAAQIFDWVFKKHCIDPDKMTNLSAPLRAWLKEKPKALTKVQDETSLDSQTTKTLWRLHDGAMVESVLIEAPGRFTLCVSSQVGCAARCSFCASGKQGLIRNLSTAEILEQFVNTQSKLAEKGEHLTNVVYMGMGEPLHNLEAVISTIKMLVDPKGAHLSARRITVSTVGVIEGIDKLAEADLGVNLVLSLHAPNQEIRKKIIPLARQYDLADVLAACDRYSEKSGRDLTYEYTLIAGWNDQPEHAEELVELVGKRQCTVNLIPYNPIDGLKLERPETEVIQEFRYILTEGGIINTCRYTKGVDIAAACGQLALKKQPQIKENVNSPFKIIEESSCDLKTL
jgi:23S rRNA (adenine2503-C2)-methyltransferase